MSDNKNSNQPLNIKKKQKQDSNRQESQEKFETRKVDSNNKNNLTTVTERKHFKQTSTVPLVEKVSNLASLIDQAPKAIDKIFLVKGVISEIFAEEYAYYLSDNTATVRLVCSEKNSNKRLKIGQMIQLKVRVFRSRMTQVGKSLKLLERSPFNFLIESEGTLVYIKKDQKFLVQETEPIEYGSLDYSLRKLSKSKLPLNHETFDCNVLKLLLSCLSFERIQELERKFKEFKANQILAEILDCFENAKKIQQMGEGKSIDKCYKLFRLKYANVGKNKSLNNFDGKKELPAIRLGRLNDYVVRDPGQESFEESQVELPLFTHTKVWIFEELSNEDQELLRKGYSDMYGEAKFVKLDELAQYFGKKNEEIIIKHLANDL
ncbi:predicted protein [Naegleria gruberi]|uniref:Predicted protein n=1 Tax=Naegleria gruberi TaxID=5762 RepID=D2VR57_NAEGR|nr:uncharacterized protein NAEGRDRAFT_51602 [Naegleria gruberi]EFC40838.1 predicted protein [Naegleria gruberi]|eukprot:XP_002673582.1 predicted protein [Naegleria gruberi strain NEG-M]